MGDIYSDEELRKMGDVNGDGIIDMKDVDIMRATFGSTPGSPNWNPACDLNGDGVVNIKDATILGTNYGQVSTKYFTKRLTFSVPAPIIFGAILTVLSR
jgi:hypothetical protein